MSCLIWCILMTKKSVRTCFLLCNIICGKKNYASYFLTLLGSVGQKKLLTNKTRFQCNEPLFRMHLKFLLSLWKWLRFRTICVIWASIKGLPGRCLWMEYPLMWEMSWTMNFSNWDHFECALSFTPIREKISNLLSSFMLYSYVPCYIIVCHGT